MKSIVFADTLSMESSTLRCRLFLDNFVTPPGGENGEINQRIVVLRFSWGVSFQSPIAVHHNSMCNAVDYRSDPITIDSLNSLCTWMVLLIYGYGMGMGMVRV